VVFFPPRPWLISSGAARSTGCCLSADGVVMSACPRVQLSESSPRPSLSYYSRDDDVVIIADVIILYFPQDREFTSCLKRSPQDRRGAGQDHPQGPRGSLDFSMGPTIAAPEFNPSSMTSYASPGMVMSLSWSCSCSCPDVVGGVELLQSEVLLRSSSLSG
jgi:hypothetical protein